MLITQKFALCGKVQMLFSFLMESPVIMNIYQVSSDEYLLGIGGLNDVCAVELSFPFPSRQVSPLSQETWWLAIIPLWTKWVIHAYNTTYIMKVRQSNEQARFVDFYYDVCAMVNTIRAAPIICWFVGRIHPLFLNKSLVIQVVFRRMLALIGKHWICNASPHSPRVQVWAFMWFLPIICLLLRLLTNFWGFSVCQFYYLIYLKYFFFFNFVTWNFNLLSNFATDLKNKMLLPGWLCLVYILCICQVFQLKKKKTHWNFLCILVHVAVWNLNTLKPFLINHGLQRRIVM